MSENMFQSTTAQKESVDVGKTSAATGDVQGIKPAVSPVNSARQESSRHMNPAMLSFISLFFLGVSVLFLTLWYTETQKNVSVSVVTTEEQAQTAAAATYTMPQMLAAVDTIVLPKPETSRGMSVEQALAVRRSKRVYSDEPVALADLSQMLWAGQGITDEQKHRTAPSARGVYPHTLYAVVRNVTGLEPGLYRYEPETHALSDLGVPDAGERLAAAGVQDNSQKAPVVIVLATAFAKAQKMFPETAVDVSNLEAGHIGQNISLQAESLGLGTVVTAGFNSAVVAEKIGLDVNEYISYLIPFGHPGEEIVQSE